MSFATIKHQTLMTMICKMEVMLEILMSCPNKIRLQGIEISNDGTKLFIIFHGNVEEINDQDY